MMAVVEAKGEEEDVPAKVLVSKLCICVSLCCARDNDDDNNDADDNIDDDDEAAAL